MGSFEDNKYDYETGHENVNNTNASSSFEFPKGGGDRAFHHRPVLGSLSKPAPSKWDDAQKWLVSISSGGGDHGYAKNKSKASNALRKINFPPRPSKTSSSNASEMLFISSSTPVPADEEKEVELNHDEGETKKIDYDKSSRRIDKPIADTAGEHISYIPPPSTGRSVSMRDMGTDMTPITSQEPSRTGTPIRATTPSIGSPVSSRPSTPGRSLPRMEGTENYQSGLKDHHELSVKQLHEKTRREIMALGAQLGKSNIAAWASKEEEEQDASKSLKTNDMEQAKMNILEARAAAWEEAEQAKYMASVS
eukprot:Gb_00647 [translate_table: standard]